MQRLKTLPAIPAALNLFVDRLMPRPLRRSLMQRVRRAIVWPRVSQVKFGDLRRLSPVCADWGYGRGTPIDRYYIEAFLARHAASIRGRVLEIGTDTYTRRFGGDRVTRSDVLHVAENRPPITIVGDLVTGNGLPLGAFDCVVVTQTLQFVYDVHAVVRTLHRLLVPGGVALVTVPGITKMSPEDMALWGQYWSFTSQSARRLFHEAFAPERVSVEPAGNVLAATAFLHGLAAEELTGRELQHTDPAFETLLGIRAQRSTD